MKLRLLLSFLICLCATLVSAASTGKLKVFILAGQSNMEGKGKVELAERQLQDPRFKDFYTHLRKDGKWIVRDDVWINFHEHHGKLTVGYGSPGCIGPELEFGIVVGDYFKAPVLLIKTAWGGRSLGRDFLPPSANGRPKNSCASSPRGRTLTTSGEAATGRR